MANEENKIYERPWGTYQSLKIEKTTQVKWIVVKPKSKLSLQKHEKRQEHWIVAKGEAIITIDDKKQKYKVSDHVFIPKLALHRIENETDETVIIVEVQIGSYLGEDDIIRVEDEYGRS